MGNKIRKCRKSHILLFSLFFILLILLSLSSFVFAKEYSNPSAAVYYNLNSDGTIDVVEWITYVVDCQDSDCFYEIFYFFPKDLKIINPTGYCQEVNCNFRTSITDNTYELILRKEDGFKSGIYCCL